MNRLVLIFALSALACAGPKVALKTGDVPGLKTHRKPTVFVAGPRIEPQDQLLAWLHRVGTPSAGPKPLIKLPVLFRFAANRLKYQALVGVKDHAPDKHSIELALDDSTLGDSLRDQLRFNCPKDIDWCAIWLEGYWGEVGLTLSELNPIASREQKSPPQWAFGIRVVHGLVDPHEPAQVYLEGPSQ